MISPEMIAEIFGELAPKAKSDSHTFGTVTNIEGEHLVVKLGSQEVRCARLCDASVGDRVFVAILTNGQCVALGRVGGFAEPDGVIKLFAGTVNKVPAGWLSCDGAAVSRAEYPFLFDAIGTNYGAGDGLTTFNLPDLRGRFALGSSSSYELGATGGEENHVLTTNELPAHSHTADYKGFSGLTESTSGWMLGRQIGASHDRTDIGTNETGGGQAHNNMPPYLAINYIIKATKVIV